MNQRVRLACEPAVVVIPLDRILPTRVIDGASKKAPKYRCIQASIRELGLIEPLVVHPQSKSSSSYLLLDGHVRLEVLRDLGLTAAKCLVATDDEGFTYNHKVNRLSPIQEHFMMLKAIKGGLSETRIARTLNVNVAAIRQKRELLEGICPEAVQLLREKRATAQALRELRKVKPMRQIEMAELMCASNTFSVSYAKCLVAATPQEQMADPEHPKDSCGLSAKDVERMEHEMQTLGKEFKIIEESHGKNTLNLVVVVGYLRRLLDNVRVVRFLSQHHHELLSEFQKLVEARELTESPTAG